jgi:hypothetical protein
MDDPVGHVTSKSNIPGFLLFSTPQWFADRFFEPAAPTSRAAAHQRFAKNLGRNTFR